MLQLFATVSIVHTNIYVDLYLTARTPHHSTGHNADDPSGTDFYILPIQMFVCVIDTVVNNCNTWNSSF